MLGLYLVWFPGIVLGVLQPSRNASLPTMPIHHETMLQRPRQMKGTYSTSDWVRGCGQETRLEKTESEANL